MKTILTPVDFSAISKAVVKSAAELARSLDARLVLMHVVQPPVITSEYGAVMANIQEIVAVSEKTAARHLELLVQKLKAAGLEASCELLTGSPTLHIVDQARKLSADYVVLGSHGHSALYDLLAGSTASGVLKKSPCPVVVIPPAPKKKSRR
jgi:nucleotide-binding universal stress UspA family protein